METRLTSQADLATEVVAGDKLTLVYDVKSDNAYWLGLWADEIDKALSKVSIYDVTGYTNNGDGTLSFHVTIKPFATRISDGLAISVEDLKRQQSGEPVQGEVSEANATAIVGCIAAAAIAWALAYTVTASFKYALIKRNPEVAKLLGGGVLSETKDTLNAGKDLGIVLILGFAIWLAYSVFLKGAK